MKFETSVESEDKVQLDLKDRKILTKLGQDARIPVTQIAKEVELSRDAIRYRINNYEKRGLIQGYRAVINVAKFGFDNYHCFLQLTKPSKVDEQKIIDNLRKLNYIRAILKFSGKYDIELAVIARNVHELEEHIEEIKRICGKHLIENDILVITKTYQASSFPKNFLEIPLPEKKVKIVEYDTDKKDLAILKILSMSAREALFSVAQKVGLSADAVNYRLKKMIASNYISAFVPAINYDLLGYHVYACLMSMKTLDEVEEAKLKQFFSTNKNILWSVKCIGKYNVLFYISAKNPNAIHESVHELRDLFPEKIKEYETLIAYEEYKYNYFPEAISNSTK